ncbi:MAG TPA: class I SAM-dependent methyltransferase [Eubacteriales bacterium]|nr:class I SAM-dependent methyltransferase [Eubacteriales bacterium]
MQDAYWESLWRTENPGECLRFIRGHARSRPAFLSIFERFGVRRVCDAACGFGAYSAMLLANGYDVSGFDIAESAVSLTKTLLSAIGMSPGEYKVCSICDIAFSDRAFGAVTAHAVIDHLPVAEAGRAIDELFRITADGGLVYLSFDPLEDDDLAAPHEILPDGSFLYSGAQRDGLLFHYYLEEELNALLAGRKIVYRNLTARKERELILQKL